MTAQRDPHISPAIRAFGTEIEAWRTAAGLTRAELADALGCTPQWIGQLETFKNTPSKPFALDLDTYFNTNGFFHRLWKLVNETRDLAGLPPGFPDFLAREARATLMHIF